MSNLRSDCRELVSGLPVGDTIRSHVERLCHQIDQIEDLWHAAERDKHALLNAAVWEGVALDGEPGWYWQIGMWPPRLFPATKEEAIEAVKRAAGIGTEGG